MATRRIARRGSINMLRDRLGPVRGERAGPFFVVEAGMDEPVRIGRNKGRRVQAQPQGGRKLFGAAAKKVFLEWFAGTANLSWAARKAGVHYRTVLRHRMDDPAFRAAYDEAEAQSGPRLRAWLMQAKEEDDALIAAALDGEDGAPGGDPAPVNMTIDQTFKVLPLLNGRDAAGGRRAAASGESDGPGGRGHGRPPTVASNQEVRDALVKALLAHGVRVRAEREE